jgi:valyl-tRNA synthetase
MSETSAKTYDPTAVEDKWYGYWKSKGYFDSDPDERPPYVVVIPPPNVTGVLHMGHMLNNTIQDVLVRRKRMQGFNACWVPGTDHASIATEAKVVAMLREQGIKKSDLSREEFLRHAWAWKEKYGGVILKQLEKLGASCDWRRTRFTMEPKLSQAVIDVFVDLYEKGLIYRGLRMVNWDPVGKTALSDEEVVRRDVKGKLYYVLYRFAEQGLSGPNGDKGLVVATTRPETFFADVAVAVHPHDERYRNLVGKTVRLPVGDRRVPIIADAAVDPEFGTGCLKVTPAHDTLDYEIGQRHGLEILEALTEDGYLTEICGRFAGLERFAAREAVAKDVAERGLSVKVEDVVQSVGFSERTHAVVEPRLSLQWFVSMKPLAEKALPPVLNGEIKLIPDRFVNTYRHWMENVRDWCISRQLWWGQRIPVYYYDTPAGERYVVARDEKSALEKARQAGYSGNQLRQDPDVLDTWFSSWLWPISVFDGFDAGPDFKYYYPTDDLVTAPEILFFWVARMIMAGYEYTGQKPFKNVYLTGIVRDKLGRKMSKSLGNSPDPLDLIARYGADAVRVGMLLCSPAGNDLLFDESLCEQGRNFANKIWNAFRLFKSWEGRLADIPPTDVQLFHLRRMEMEAEHAAARLQDHFDKYRMSDALMTVYKLFWDDFCATFLEGVKTRGELSRAVYERATAIFERLLMLLHPFMPFITEELWHALRSRGEGEDLIVSRLAPPAPVDDAARAAAEWTLAGLAAIQRTLQLNKLPHQSPIRLFICPIKPGYDPWAHRAVFENALNLVEWSVGTQHELEKKFPVGVKLSDASPGFAYYIFPTAADLDPEAERRRLREEVQYLEGFLKSVEAKLNNEKFVANAKPEVVARERQKYADATAKIEALKRSLA